MPNIVWFILVLFYITSGTLTATMMYFITKRKKFGVGIVLCGLIFPLFWMGVLFGALGYGILEAFSWLAER